MNKTHDIVRCEHILTQQAVRSCRVLNHEQYKHKSFCLYSAHPSHQSSTNMRCLSNITFSIQSSVTAMHFQVYTYRTNHFMFVVLCSKILTVNFTQNSFHVYLAAGTHRLQFRYEQKHPSLSRYWWRHEHSSSAFCKKTIFLKIVFKMWICPVYVCTCKFRSKNKW